MRILTLFAGDSADASYGTPFGRKRLAALVDCSMFFSNVVRSRLRRVERGWWRRSVVLSSRRS